MAKKRKSTILLEHCLKQLKLPMIGRDYAAVAAVCGRENVSFETFLLRLCERELTERQQRAMERRIKAAKFPTLKTIESFKFDAQPGINEPLIRELLVGEFIDQRENVLLIGNSGTGNLSQRNAPLVTEECEGQVTGTDPKHPLFGRTFKLAGIARLPGHVRHCQVELLPHQFGYVPVASTELSTEPQPDPTVLTLISMISIEELVATYRTLPIVRRRKHATRSKSQSVGPAAAKRSKRSGRKDHSHSHGKARK